jgi:hypothetical protein
MSFWKVRGTLKNAMAKPGEKMVGVYFRIILNNMLSPFSGLVFCAYYLWSGQQLGHDGLVTALFVCRWFCFLYSVWKYVDKVIGRVAEGVADMDDILLKRRYLVVIFVARWFWVPGVFGGVRWERGQFLGLALEPRVATLLRR